MKSNIYKKNHYAKDVSHYYNALNMGIIKQYIYTTIPLH